MRKEVKVMDKYTKAMLMVIKIPVGVFCALAGLGLIGVSVWVSTFSDIASMILLISLLAGGALINFGVGYAFLGDEYKATGIVHDGNTTFMAVETPKFLKRRKIVMLVGSISYLVLALFYIVRAILSSIYKGYLQDIDYNSSIAALIAFSVVSLVVAFCLFMLYMRTKHIDLKEE
jgi:hypothetical protein